MRIINRSEIGVKYTEGFGERPLPVRDLFAHYSLTKGYGPNATPREDAASARTIINIGQSRFGRGPSYNYAITEAGRVFELLRPKRIGSHTKGHNTTGIGIVFVGDFTKRLPSQKALDAFEWLVASLVSQGAVRKDFRLRGHRDVVATSCPGKYIHSRLPDLGEVARMVIAHPTLRPGSFGPEVLLVKKILKGLGYGGMNLKSKKFGSGTEKAVRAWQTDTPLVATTGVISNDDWARLL